MFSSAPALLLLLLPLSGVEGGTIEMPPRQCMRCLLLSAAAWSLALTEGQAFLMRTCFRVGTESLRSSSSPLSQRRTRASTGSHLPYSEMVEPLAVSPENVDTPGQWSPMRDLGEGGNGGDDQEEDFNINLGRALDYLAADVPLMFSTAPRLEIFTSQIRLKDPVGELCHGRRVYGALHTSLRVIGAITTTTPRVGVTCINYHGDKREIELKWTLAANAPFMGDAMKLSAVSIYRVNEHGLIYEHCIDNRIKRDLWEYSHSWMGLLKADSPPSA